MGAFENFPYSNFHNLNLDWIIQKVKEDLAAVAALTVNVSDFQTAVNSSFSTFQTAMNGSFTELETWCKGVGLSADITSILNAWKTDGTWDDLINQKVLSGISAQLADKADKSAVTNVLTPKGFSTFAALPATGNTTGWYYYCADGDGTHGAGNYVWNGSSWYFGGTGDDGYNKVSNEIANLGSSVLLENLPKLTQVYTTTGLQVVGGFSSTDFLPLTDIIYRNLHTSTYTTIYAVAFFDSEYSFISGVLGGKNSTALETVAIPTPPTNAMYVKFSYIVHTATIGNVYPYYEIIGFKKDITSIKTDIDKMLSNVLFENLPKFPQVYTTTGYQSYGGYFSTDFLPVENMVYKSIHVAPYANIYAIAFFDSEHNFISGVLGGANSTTQKAISAPTTPTNAAFVKFSYLEHGFTIGNEYAYAELIGSKYEIEELKTLANVNDFMKHYFTNILCIGDSLTAGDYGSYPAGTANVHSENYPFYLSKMTGATVTNKGICGYSSVMYWNSIADTIDTTKTYDSIYIFLGTNGGLTDTVDTDAAGADYATYTTTTQTGAYCAIVAWCKQKFPNAHIFLLNFPYNDREISWTTANSAIVAKIATKFSATLIDVMTKSPFTRDNGQIYRPVGYDVTNEPLGNLHFGRLGYLTLANVVTKLTQEDIDNNKINYAL
jgi:lysophospholipase L1-like esterase